MVVTGEDGVKDHVPLAKLVSLKYCNEAGKFASKFNSSTAEHCGGWIVLFGASTG